MPKRSQGKPGIFVPDPYLMPLQIDVAFNPAARSRVAERMEGIFARQNRLVIRYLEWSAGERRSHPPAPDH